MRRLKIKALQWVKQWKGSVFCFWMLPFMPPFYVFASLLVLTISNVSFPAPWFNTPLMKQDLAAWSDGVQGDLQRIAILNDAQICGLTQLIWQYNEWYVDFSFLDNQSGVIPPCYPFETEAKLTKCIEGGIFWGSASIVLGNRFECCLYAICMPFVLIDMHSTYFNHVFHHGAMSLGSMIPPGLS